MSRRDTYHDIVVSALEREGWIVTDDPFIIAFGAQDLQVDLGLEMPIGAERGGEKIAVEIKSFLGASAITDFYLAFGQFAFYRSLLALRGVERKIYLAMPDDAYHAIFDLTDGEAVRVHNHLPLIVYEPVEGAPLQWIE